MTIIKKRATRRKPAKKAVRKTKKRTGPYSKKDSAGRRMWFSATGKRITKAKAYALMGKKLPKAVTKTIKKKSKGKKRTSGLTAAQKKYLKEKKLKKKLKKLKKQLKEQKGRSTVSAQQPIRRTFSSQQPQRIKTTDIPKEDLWFI